MERTKLQTKVPSVNEVMGKNLPDKKFRAGAIHATVWTNETVRDGKKVAYKTISFERSYKDKDGEWKTTNSLRTTDIPKAILVLNKAFEYVSLDQGEEEEDYY